MLLIDVINLIKIPLLEGCNNIAGKRKLPSMDAVQQENFCPCIKKSSFRLQQLCCLC